MLQKLFRIIFWSGYTAVLFVSALSLPWRLDKIHIGMPEFYIRLDHLLHLGAYFIICLYYLTGQYLSLKLFEYHSLRKFIFATVLLATVTEFVQIWVPSRAFNVMDWVANVAGIGLGLVVIMLVRKNVNQPS